MFPPAPRRVLFLVVLLVSSLRVTSVLSASSLCQANATYSLVVPPPWSFPWPLLKKESQYVSWQRYACLLWPVLYLPHTITSFSPNFWLLILASEVEELVFIQSVYVGQQQQKSNRTFVKSTWMTKGLNIPAYQVCPKFAFKIPIKTPETDR